jgi:hypothetical protein
MQAIIFVEFHRGSRREAGELESSAEMRLLAVMRASETEKGAEALLEQGRLE